MENNGINPMAYFENVVDVHDLLRKFENYKKELNN